jgi:hypothetical protein
MLGESDNEKNLRIGAERKAHIELKAKNLPIFGSSPQVH